MVKSIQAFAADDGSIFASERAALEHDALEKLKKMDIFNHASATAIVAQAKTIVDLLGPLVAAQVEGAD